MINAAHPLGVALGEVVIHRDKVDPVASERVQGGGKRSGKRFSLTSAHLGNFALMEDSATYELHVEWSLADASLGCLTGQSERLYQEVIELFALVIALLQIGDASAELLIAEGLKLGLQIVDFINERLDVTDLLIVGVTHDPGKE
jgi:hypothetical protein